MHNSITQFAFSKELIFAKLHVSVNDLYSFSCLLLWAYCRYSWNIHQSERARIQEPRTLSDANSCY